MRNPRHVIQRRSGPSPLRRFAVLDSIPDHELVAVERSSTHLTLEAGSALWRQGTLGREAVLVLDGQAAVIQGDRLVVVEAGELLGEMSLLDGGRRSADVTALSALDVLVFTPAEFGRVFVVAPALARQVCETLSKRLRAAQRG